MNTHSMKLCEPWYSYVKNGRKNIEGRIYDDKRKLLKIGDLKFNSCSVLVTSSKSIFMAFPNS